MHFGLQSYESNLYFHIAEIRELQDADIFEVSQRITNKQELLKLGVKALKLPAYVIQAAIYNAKEDIQSASYEVLSSWVKEQANREEAYTNLVASLEQCQMFHLVLVLRPSTNQKETFAALSSESKYCYCDQCKGFN